MVLPPQPKIQQYMAQLVCGEARIVFEPLHESYILNAMLEQWELLVHTQLQTAIDTVLVTKSISHHHGFEPSWH